MFLEEITAAQDSINQVRGDFYSLNTAYNELLNYELKIEGLKNTKAIKKFFIHFLPLALLHGTLSAILLKMGRLGAKLSEMLSLALFGLSLYYVLRFEESPYFKYRVGRIRAQQEPIENTIARLTEKIEDYFRGDPAIDLVPETYRYPQAVDFFQELASLGRASDLKEAMNLYELQLHQWKLEEDNQKIMELQERSIREAKGAKTASTMAASFALAAMLSRD